MTLEEKQEFLVLKALVPTNKRVLSREEYEQLTKEITGDSEYHIKEILKNKGYFSEGDNFWKEGVDPLAPMHMRLKYGCHITDLGIKAYHEYAIIRRNRIIRNVAFWILFVSSVVAGSDVVLKWFKKEPPSKVSTSPSIAPAQSPSKTVQAPALKSDTTAVPKSDSAAGTKKKKPSS